MNIALYDYGAGNLHSLGKALEAGGASVLVTGSWTEALGQHGLVLPGVGAFGAAVRSLLGERERVRDALRNGLPCLGICLGMQILFDSSEEGEGEGIGIIPGAVRRLRARVIPQMGWNDVRVSVGPAAPEVLGEAAAGAARAQAQGRVIPAGVGPTPPAHTAAPSPDPLFRGQTGLVAYFANSYVCAPQDPSTVVATTEYQGDVFPAAVRLGRTWGVQFHPEKSSAPGLALLRNFLQEVRS